VILILQARALAHDRFAAAALAVTTELALLAGCERVSVGFRAQGRTRLAAMSGGGDIRHEQNLVRAIGEAMDEAIEQRAAIVFPLPRSATPAITLAHSELARIGGQAAIHTVPIVLRERVLGAFVFEAGAAFDARTLQLARDAALLVGPVLELRHRIDAPLGRRVLQAVAGGGHGSGATAHRAGRRSRSVLGGLTLAGGLLALWPATDRVVAPARLEGLVERVIAAPVDGFVGSVAVRPGARVTRGQLLVSLEDRELALERERRRSENAQLDKLYGEALSGDDAAQIVVARARLEQARSELDLAESRLERSRLVAPIDGVVISGDLAQSLGAPVKRGQELMKVAPRNGFRVVIEVDEQDVARLRDGQRATVLFAALPGAPVALDVSRIAPVATVIDERNVYEVEGSLDAAALLRPGLRGVARIATGQRVLGAILVERAANWLRRTAWRVLG